MAADVFLVLGLLILAFSVVALFSAVSQDRSPLPAFFVVAIGLGSLVHGISLNSYGFVLADVPHAFLRVLAMILP